MSAIKRHKPDTYRRTQEAIRLSRQRKKIDAHLEAAAELVAEESEARCKNLRVVIAADPSASESPPVRFRRRRLIEAEQHVCAAAAVIGRKLTARFEHVIVAPRPLAPAPTPGPARHRGYEFPKATPSRWDPSGTRIELGESAILQESQNRRAAAIAWSAANCRDGIPDLRSFAGVDVEACFLHAACGAPAQSPLQWRTRHHADCASNRDFGPPCDCSPLFLIRAGCQTFAVARDGKLTPHIEPRLTRDAIAHFDPATRRSERGDQRGFLGEFDLDRHGRLLVPDGTPFRELSDGTITFAEAGLPPAKTSPITDNV